MFYILTVEPWFEVIQMVRAATRLGRAAVVQTGERIRGLSTGRLSIYRQPFTKEQAQKKVQS